MQDFTGVYHQQREALYALLKNELLTGVEIKPEVLAQMAFAIAQFLGVALADADFQTRVEKFRDTFFCLEEKKVNEFMAVLESDNVKGQKFSKDDIKKYAEMISDVWRLILCVKAQSIEEYREYRKYIEKIVKPNAKSNLLELHQLVNDLYQSKYYKQLTINKELPLAKAQLPRYFQLIFYYTQHIVSKKMIDHPLNFHQTGNWLNPFVESIHELVDEFSGITDPTRTALFTQLIEEGDADGLAIINEEEYAEQQQDRVIWTTLAPYWPELVLLINDPEASRYFNCIFVQGKDGIILSPKESLDLQNRVKLVLLEKMQADNDRVKELERLQHENDALRKKMAELLAARNGEAAAEPPQKQARVQEDMDGEYSLLRIERDQALAQVQQLTSQREQDLQRLAQMQQLASQHEQDMQRLAQMQQLASQHEQDTQRLAQRQQLASLHEQDLQRLAQMQQLTSQHEQDLQRLAQLQQLTSQHEQDLVRLAEMQTALSQAQERIQVLEAAQSKYSLLSRPSSKFAIRSGVDEKQELEWLCQLPTFKAPSPQSPQEKKIKKEPTPPPMADNPQRFFLGMDEPTTDPATIMPLSTEAAQHCAADLVAHFKLLAEKKTI